MTSGPGLTCESIDLPLRLSQSRAEVGGIRAEDNCDGTGGGAHLLATFRSGLSDLFNQRGGDGSGYGFAGFFVAGADEGMFFDSA